MRRRVSVRAIAVAAMIAVIAVVGVDLAADLSAMACCAATNYACKGMRAPDDCCRAMHHAASRPSTSATAIHVAHAPVTAPSILPATFLPAIVATPLDTPRLKRPHDPPHLHTFALLI